ncbi:MAG: tetratricopeptide repeat protein, partial [Sphingomicrobium sp.]
MHRNSIVLACLLVSAAAPALSQSGYYRQPAPAPQVPPPAATPAATPEVAASVRPSAGALKPIIALQKAYASKDPAAIASALAAAKAAAATKEDRYVIGQLQLRAALAANDNAETGAAIELVAGSGYLPAGKAAELYMAYGNGLSEKKQYAEAAAAFERGLALDPNNLGLLGNLGEARFAQGRKAEAIPYFQKLIAATIATGVKPSEPVYKRAVSIANEAKLPVSVELASSWVVAYPSPVSWSNAIALYQNVNKPDVEGSLNLLRLLRATGAMSSPAHYSLYSTAAADQGNYVEAQAVIDEGLAKNVFTASSPVIKDVIAGLKAKQKATAADLETAS